MAAALARQRLPRAQPIRLTGPQVELRFARVPPVANAISSGPLGAPIRCQRRSGVIAVAAGDAGAQRRRHVYRIDRLPRDHRPLHDLRQPVQATITPTTHRLRGPSAAGTQVLKVSPTDSARTIAGNSLTLSGGTAGSATGRRLATPARPLRHSGGMTTYGPNDWPLEAERLDAGRSASKEEERTSRTARCDTRAPAGPGSSTCAPVVGAPGPVRSVTAARIGSPSR